MGDALREDLLSISQAARLLGVQPLTLRRWDNSGVLVADFRTLGGCRRYSRKRLQEILDRHELPDGNTPRISDLILKGDNHDIKETMEKGTDYGMRTFDRALLDLLVAGKISEETALTNADSQNNLRLAIREKFQSQRSEKPEWTIR